MTAKRLKQYSYSWPSYVGQNPEPAPCEEILSVHPEFRSTIREFCQRCQGKPGVCAAERLIEEALNSDDIDARSGDSQPKLL